MLWDYCVKFSHLSLQHHSFPFSNIFFLLHIKKKKFSISTYRNGNIIFLIACFYLSTEAQNCVRCVLTSRKQYVILWKIQNRLSIISMTWNVTILRKYKNNLETKFMYPKEHEACSLTLSHTLSLYACKLKS
jgi:hypothetical protein